MLNLILGNWRLIAAGIVAAVVGGYVLHCESSKKRLAQSIAIAEEQQRANAKQALRDIKNKERSDENYQRNLARLAADVKRLRDSSPVFVPSAGSSPGGVERACFDRAELDAALRSYRAGVVGLLAEGAQAIEALDESKAWAADR